MREGQAGKLEKVARWHSRSSSSSVRGWGLIRFATTEVLGDKPGWMDGYSSGAKVVEF